MTAAPARTILHADMDAFYAAVEQRDRPELRGKPVIIGGQGPRHVVATASYEARRFGVRSAMPSVRARQLCPHGIFVRPRMEAYAAASEAIQRVFDGFTDLVEPLSLDEAFLDVTGSRALFGDGAAIARRLKDAVFSAVQLTVSVGVARNKFLAKVASDLQKPDGLVVVPAEAEREFLAPLPVRRLWGIGEKSEPLLHARALRTIGDVQRQPLERLVGWFGAAMGQRLHELAHGRDDRPVEPSREALTIGNETTFERDLRSFEAASAALLSLCEQVARRLRQADRSAGLVRLKLRLSDFSTTTRQRVVEPCQDGLVLHRQAVSLLREAWSGEDGIRLLGVTAAKLGAAGASRQGSLFGPSRAAGGALLAAMDAIKDRHGEQAVFRLGQRSPDAPSP